MYSLHICNCVLVASHHIRFDSKSAIDVNFGLSQSCACKVHMYLVDVDFIEFPPGWIFWILPIVWQCPQLPLLAHELLCDGY